MNEIQRTRAAILFLEIQQTSYILQFLENGHDLDGTHPQPLMRSFAVRYDSTFQQMRMDEHDARLQYYRNRLRELKEEYEEYENVNKRRKTRQ